jgi:hypothetical protein
MKTWDSARLCSRRMRVSDFFFVFVVYGQKITPLQSSWQAILFSIIDFLFIPSFRLHLPASAAAWQGQVVAASERRVPQVSRTALQLRSAPH